MGRAKTIKTYPPESRLSVGFQDFPTLHPIRSLFFTGKNPPCWGSQPIIPSTGQPVSPPLYGIGHHQCGWRMQLHFPPFLSPVLSCLVFPSICVYCFCLHFFPPSPSQVFKSEFRSVIQGCLRTAFCRWHSLIVILVSASTLGSCLLRLVLGLCGECNNSGLPFRLDSCDQLQMLVRSRVPLQWRLAAEVASLIRLGAERARQFLMC